jgi:hypothetical protein
MNADASAGGVAILGLAGLAALLISSLIFAAVISAVIFAVNFALATIGRGCRTHTQANPARTDPTGRAWGTAMLVFLLPFLFAFGLAGGLVFLANVRMKTSDSVEVTSRLQTTPDVETYSPEPVVIVQNPTTKLRSGESSVELSQTPPSEQQVGSATDTTAAATSQPVPDVAPAAPAAPERPATPAAAVPERPATPVAVATAAPPARTETDTDKSATEKSATGKRKTVESADGILAEVAREVQAAGIEVSTDLQAAAIEIREEVGNAMREVSSELMGEVAGLQAELAGKRRELDSVIARINAALATPLSDGSRQAERLGELKQKMRGLRDELRRAETKLGEHVRELTQRSRKKASEAKARADQASVERGRGKDIRVELFGSQVFGKRRSPAGQPQLIPEVVTIQHRGDITSGAPAWATPEGASSIGPNQFVVSSQRFATLAEAELQLTSAVLDRAYQVLSSQSNKVLLSPGLIDQYAIKECVAERMEKDFGEVAGRHEMFRVHALVEMNPRVRDLAGDLWRIEEVRKRTRVLGIGTASLIGLVIVTAISMSSRRGLAIGLFGALLGLGCAIAGAVIGLAG